MLTLKENSPRYKMSLLYKVKEMVTANGIAYWGGFPDYWLIYSDENFIKLAQAIQALSRQKSWETFNYEANAYGDIESETHCERAITAILAIMSKPSNHDDAYNLIYSKAAPFLKEALNEELNKTHTAPKPCCIL